MKIESEENISYDEYIKRNEESGWKKEYTVLTEKDKNLVTVHSGYKGEMWCVVDVRCPRNKKISIAGKNCKYTLKLKLSDKSNKELSIFSKMFINKENNIKDFNILGRMFYDSIRNFDDSRAYNFKDDVEIIEGEHITINTVAETPTGGPILPDIDIDSKHVKFELGCDIWSKE